MNYTVYKGAHKHFKVLDEDKVGQGLGEKLVMTAQHSKRTSKKKASEVVKGLQWLLSNQRRFKEEQMRTR